MVKTIEGVKNISNYEDLKNYSFDFIMCNHLFEHLPDQIKVLRMLKDIGSEKTVYYIEVPSENPFINGNKFSLRKNLPLIFNPNYNIFRLAKYYLQQRKGAFMPLKEHINFYTNESFRVMAEQNGFSILEIAESTQKQVLGNITVLSMLMKLQRGK